MNTTTTAVSVADRLAECEPMIRTVAKSVIHSRGWLTAGGCDVDDAAQAGRMEVVRLAELYPDIAQDHFRHIAATAVRRRMLDLARNVGTQVGVRRVKGGGTGGLKGTANPSVWLRIDCTERSVRFGGDENKEKDKSGVLWKFDQEHADTREQEFASFVRLWCGGLSAVERCILKWHYVREWPMRLIADTLGISESRVSQMLGVVKGKLGQATAGRMRMVRERMAWRHS